MGIQERREREKKQRREHILACALNVFAKHGFTGSTMEMIAEEAELSKGAIYLYFTDKDELFSTLAEISVEEFFESMRKSVERVSDPKERIRRSLEGVLEYFRIRREAIRMLLIADSHLSQKVHDSVHNVAMNARERTIEILRWTLKPAAKAGLFRKGITLDTASFFFHSTMMGAISWLLLNEDANLDDKIIVDTTLDLFAHGTFKHEK